MIEFCASISKYPCQFNNHLSLLDYLQTRLPAICDSASGYKFRIYFHLDYNDITDVIATLLQIPPIQRCSFVEIEIPVFRGGKNQLPVEAISNWLEKSVPRMEFNDRKQKEKFLKIWMNDIPNVQEMIDHLKMVYLNLND